MYRITATQQRSLLEQPESGMGYQLVEIVTDTNQTLRALAYNAELVLPEGRDHRVMIHEYLTAKLANDRLETGVREIRVLSRPADRAKFLVNEAVAAYGQHTYKGPAKDAPIVKTKADELFRRFCAFANDRRITADGKLTPGTYATTLSDSMHVKTGKQAVARYALPNPEPAVHRFTILPGAGLDIQYGIVEPAYGQAGGGVEVIFPGGTNAHSVIGRDEIPPE
jgi:hypothetical protein